MTRDEALEIVREARLEGFRINLYGADLYGADLSGFDLRGANLRMANLLGANLYGANLLDADLSGADLYGANLRCTNLCGANLYGPQQILPLSTPSGDGWLAPTPEGWSVTIGCWKRHTLDDLADLIADRADWPATPPGKERERRRPVLAATLAMCEAHAAYHEGVIEALAERWVGVTA